MGYSIMPKDLIGFANPEKQGVIINTRMLADNELVSAANTPTPPPRPHPLDRQPSNSFEKALQEKERRRRQKCLGGTFECKLSFPQPP